MLRSAAAEFNLDLNKGKKIKLLFNKYLGISKSLRNITKENHLLNKELVNSADQSGLLIFGGTVINLFAATTAATTYMFDYIVSGTNIANKINLTNLQKLIKLRICYVNIMLYAYKSVTPLQTTIEENGKQKLRGGCRLYYFNDFLIIVDACRSLWSYSLSSRMLFDISCCINKILKKY